MAYHQCEFNYNEIFNTVLDAVPQGINTLEFIDEIVNQDPEDENGIWAELCKKLMKTNHTPVKDFRVSAHEQLKKFASRIKTQYLEEREYASAAIEGQIAGYICGHLLHNISKRNKGEVSGPSAQVQHQDNTEEEGSS